MWDFLVVFLRDGKTHNSRSFIITNEVWLFKSCDVFWKYVALCPSHIKDNRFFIAYWNGKCVAQNVRYLLSKKNYWVPTSKISWRFTTGMHSGNPRHLCWWRVEEFGNFEKRWWVVIFDSNWRLNRRIDSQKSQNISHSYSAV